MIPIKKITVGEKNQENGRDFKAVTANNPGSYNSVIQLPQKRKGLPLGKPFHFVANAN
jgi:hypothetical protein